MMRGVFATAVGLGALVAASVGLTVRYLPISNHVVLGVAAVSPYLLLGAPAALLIFGPAGRWALCAIASLLTVAAAAVQLPLFISDKHGDDSVRVRVMTANLFLGQADAKSLLAIAEANADLLAVQELTPLLAKQLSADGVDKVFPYRVLDARADASGTGLWSRFPIDDSTLAAKRGFVHATVAARIKVNGVDVDPTVLVAHLPGPWPEPLDDWNRELGEWPQVLRDASKEADQGCVVTAGDFNSTYDMRPFRNLLRDGYRDAAEQSGAGFTPTYPANMAIPPLIGIDHLLTYQCAAASLRTVRVPGSDHLGLISTIEVPRRLG